MSGILVFTDSRGSHVDERYDNFTTYAERLRSEFDAEVYVRPEYWTTILDFIAFMEDNRKYYEKVILHAGIVDWLPKPHSYLRKVLDSKIFGREETKEEFSERFFAERSKTQLIRNNMVKYRGEHTSNLYSLDMAYQFVIPALEKFDNLLFISANGFVEGWDGDYPNGPRPEHANIVKLYSEMFERRLRSVSLSRFTDTDIMNLTHDNIHPNRAGDHYLLMKSLDFIYGW
jgi:hypothetical protein